MSRFEYQFKEMIKEAVREVLLEEIEKGTLVTVEEKEEVKQPKVENIKPKDPDSIIRPKELCDMLSISVSTLYRWQSKGDLPEKRKFGRAVGWRYGDIREWLGYD